MVGLWVFTTQPDCVKRISDYTALRKDSLPNWTAPINVLMGNCKQYSMHTKTGCIAHRKTYRQNLTLGTTSQMLRKDRSAKSKPQTRDNGSHGRPAPVSHWSSAQVRLHQFQTWSCCQSGSCSWVRVNVKFKVMQRWMPQKQEVCLLGLRGSLGIVARWQSVFSNNKKHRRSENLIACVEIVIKIHKLEHSHLNYKSFTFSYTFIKFNHHVQSII